MKISIVVPCYNEEKCIKITNERILKIVEVSGNDYEIIYIDDGSTDSTIELLTRISEKNQHVKVISFSRNYGQQVAMFIGLKKASGDVIVFMDADLQDPPELLPEMIEKYLEGNNIVYAVRKNRKEGVIKVLTARAFYFIYNRLSKVNIPFNAGDYKLLDRSVANAVIKYNETDKWMKGIIASVGFKSDNVYFDRPERIAGDTKYSIIKLVRLAFKGIFSFSKVPLEIISITGFLSMGLAILAFFLVLFFKFMGYSVYGWTSMAIIVLFFSGMNLLSLGIIAYYISIIFDEVKRRPECIIKKEINI